MDAEQVTNSSRAGSTQTSQPPAKVEKEASAKPVVETKTDTVAKEQDTVSLSSEGQQALKETKSSPAGGAQNQQRNFDVTDNNEVILKITDQETQQVVKQIPAEEEVRLRQAVQEGVESLDENI